ncbi:PAS domain S-box protein [Ideonella sp. A 288]|uniref:PAS domain S-box protein n=1 Tax=Ideonella sp. A 288 TaxID=1962181 RepID=UPI001303AC62|nr:PAS domain S-box protein [Ideonella sp. A 288]
MTAATRQASDYQRLLLDRVPSMLSYWGTDLRCRFGNRAYADWFGIAPETLVGASLRDVLGPELYALNEPQFRAAFRGQGQTFERGVRDAHGQPRQALITYIPDVVDGQVVGVLVQVTDVSPLKVAQDAVKRNEEYLRELFMQSSEGILVADADGRFCDVNEACCTMLGCTAGDILGKTFEDLVWPTEVARIPLARARLQTGVRHVEEWLFRHPDGTAVPVEVRSRFLTDGRRVGFMRDITRHKQALAAGHQLAQELGRQVQHRTDELALTAQELKLSEARLRGIFESAIDAIVTLDERQIIVEANPAAATMFGCPLNELIGAPVERFIPTRFRPGHRDKVEAFGNRPDVGHQMGAQRHVSAVRADGVEFSVEAAISHVQVGGHHLYTVIHRDITERQRSEAERHAAHAALQRLIAAQDAVQENERRRIALELHDDLQQKLAAIQLNLGAVGGRLPPERGPVADMLAEAMDLASAAIESTRRIVNDLRPQILEDLGLVAALNALVRQFSQRSGIACRLVAPTDDADAALAAPAIATGLFRITQEALNNVLKHSRASAVEVRIAKLPDGRCTLTIHDNGHGMAPGDRHKAQSFGLLGMQERVRAIGGHLHIDTHAGRGTTVAVTVPAPPPAD